MNTTFSIIIPTFNSLDYLPQCLESLINQSYSKEYFEVLLIDDCSTDDTISVALQYTKRLPNLKIITLDENGGPGIARNAGIEAASNEWVLFLDSDDEYVSHGLESLHQFIESRTKGDLTAFGFDWTRNPMSDANLNSSNRVGRRDGVFLDDKSELLHQYLAHRMDGSVIYTGVRKELLDEKKIRFMSGLHEDVDFLFRVYFYSPKTIYCNKVIYVKRNRQASIINSISKNHINGYFRAWRSIGDVINLGDIDSNIRNQYLKSYRYGTIGTIATRVREVVRHSNDPAILTSLLECIFLHAKEMISAGETDVELIKCKTLYCAITSLFLKTMNDTTKTLEEKTLLIENEVRDMNGQSWSCVDLHHSLFLRPDEVRTCCKRFFVGGEMRGDVSLFEVKEQENDPVTIKRILDAKRELHQKINSGIPNPCDGCPFLEFRAWEPLNKLDIKYLSLEYHSLCNLQCSYCSEEYYGGNKPSYDITKTIEGYLEEGVLDQCALVVWGGGEPVIGEGFEYLVHTLAENLPHLQQRVLTNSVKKSPAIDWLIAKDHGQVVTSIDAGTDDIFNLVRGRNHLHRVCKNLKHYADINHSRITIKYIFTDGNTDKEEVARFVDLMQEYDLIRCVFQISGDFKNEFIDPEAAVSMVLMFGLLRKAGCNAVYFDELLWHRLGDALEKSSPNYIDKIHSLANFEFIASPEQYSSVIVWGAGQQAKYLMDNSNFFKKSEVAYFIDSTPEKKGKVFYGKEIRDPESLKSTNLPVVIAAVQGYALILQQFNNLGFSKNRLIRELIL